MFDLVFDARLLDSGGIGTYIKNLLTRLDKKRYKCSFIVHPEAPSRHDWLRQFPLIFSKSPIYSIQEQWELALKIPASEIFWSPHINVPLLPLRAKKRLATIHDVYHLAHLSSLKWLQKIYAKTFMIQAIKKADRIISCSQFSIDEIAHFVPESKEKTELIYYGINHDFFSKEIPEELHEEIKKKYDLPEHFLLFLGNLKPHKNLKNLLKAFERLQSQYPHLFLVVVGKKEGFIQGENVEMLLSSSFLKEKVRFLGYVKEEHLPIFYQLAELLAFPSFYEGFGFPPLEAMSVECPVVASSISTIKEVCGDCVEYVDPYDPGSIFNGIDRILKDPQRKKLLITKGKEKSLSYSWDLCMQQHQLILDRMLS